MGELIPFPAAVPEPAPTPREAAEKLVRGAAAWIASDYSKGSMSGADAAVVFGIVTTIATLTVLAQAPSRPARAAAGAGILQAALEGARQALRRKT